MSWKKAGHAACEGYVRGPPVRSQRRGSSGLAVACYINGIPNVPLVRGLSWTHGRRLITGNSPRAMLGTGSLYRSGRRIAIAQEWSGPNDCSAWSDQRPTSDTLNADPTELVTFIGLRTCAGHSVALGKGIRYTQPACAARRRRHASLQWRRVSCRNQKPSFYTW